MNLSVAKSMASIPAEAWAVLVPPDEPFFDHGFLSALENSGCVGPDTGWEPRTLLLHHDGALLGAACAWRKHHSDGEWFFDQQLAAQVQSLGGRYYPKLVVACPFTPITGTKLLTAPGTDTAAVREALIQGLCQLTLQEEASGLHFLYVTEQEAQALEDQGFTPCLGTQFRWHNRGYGTFDAWLSDLSHKRRQQIQRERREAHALAVTFEVHPAPALCEEDWRAVLAFYRDTFVHYGGEPYLTETFFDTLRAGQDSPLIVFLARRAAQPVGAALCYRKGRHLYGRYWGTSSNERFLHFEVSFYQLIDYAITQRLGMVDFGWGGEHKRWRGFTPSFTHGAHWFVHPGLHAGVTDWLEQHNTVVEQEVAHYRERSPLKPLR